MNRQHFSRFRPTLESLDDRAMPSTLATATVEPVNAREATTPAISEIVVTKDLDCASTNLMNPDSGEVARSTQVGDADGNVWACYYTENSCECDPL